jgi:hypothetical protein
MIYHFIFSNPTTFEIIDVLDKSPPNFFTKSLIIENISSFVYNNRFSILQKLNNFENNENVILKFSNLINDILIGNISEEGNILTVNRVIGIYSLLYKDVLKYFIIGMLFENYLQTFNKFLSIIRSKESSSTQKDDVYILLVKDFLIELNTTLLNDMGLKHIFQTDFSSPSSFNAPNESLNNLKTYFSNSNNMINSHNENITTLFLQHDKEEEEEQQGFDNDNM